MKSNNENERTEKFHVGKREQVFEAPKHHYPQRIAAPIKVDLFFKKRMAPFMYFSNNLIGLKPLKIFWITQIFQTDTDVENGYFFLIFKCVYNHEFNIHVQNDQLVNLIYVKSTYFGFCKGVISSKQLCILVWQVPQWVSFIW